METKTFVSCITLFRSIILLATRPDLANALLESNSSGALSERSQYFRSHDIGDVVILDPFMGGGTTLAEANRLGAKVVGCDLVS
jgi:adenine-specific DNA methylase